MRHHYEFRRACFIWAWRGAFKHALAWGSIVGLLAIGFFFKLQDANVTMPEQMIDAALLGFLCTLAAWGIFFSVLLWLAPGVLYKNSLDTIDALTTQLDMNRIDRLALVDLLKEAKNYGLDFTNDGMSILKFVNELRQTAHDGVVRCWGRLHRHMFEPLNRRELLVEISKSHWIDYQVDWIAAVKTDGNAIQGYADDNYRVKSYRPAHKGGEYYDLHVDKAQARAWLKENASGLASKPV